MQIEGVGKIVAVTSGKGGVGKSTLTANLAIQMAEENLKVGILDIDFYGPSITHIFDIGERPKVKEKKMTPVTRKGIKILSVGMLAEKNKAFIWTGALLKGVMQQMLFETNWGKLDVLLIDTPPGTGEILISLIEQVNVDGGVVITTPQGVAKWDVRRNLQMLQQLNIQVFSIIENMGVFSCPNCNNRVELYPKATDDLNKEFGIKSRVTLPFNLEFGNVESMGEDNSTYDLILEQIISSMQI